MAAAIPHLPGPTLGTALALLVLLGPFGAHRFYLGRPWTGAAQALLTLATVGALALFVAAPFVVALTLWLVVDIVMLPRMVRRHTVDAGPGIRPHANGG